ncbi:MAG: hypothetical protein HFE95_07210 [Acutalibacter sp.]|jgi:hypothetical protein|nr:hypothetical protein [Acutalibacter sp.]
MGGVMENAGVVCGVLVAVELIARLCPKDKMFHFVKGLTVLVLTLSLAASLLQLSWDWSAPAGEDAWRNPELEQYVQEQYRSAAEQEARTYLQGLLAAAGMKAEEITVELDMSGQEQIILSKAAFRFAYESDAQRARALLSNALGSGTMIEVTVDGH